MTQTVFPFSSSEPLALQEVGGKALSLITMTRRGLRVPPGWVLAVSYFAPWMETLSAAPEWQAAQSASGPALRQAALALQSLCPGLSFTAEQQAQLDQVLYALKTSGTQATPLFAVRSSSPEEDLENASFAGGYETTLGVTEAGLPDAIRRSFASCFAERVFLYKREHGFSTSRPRIAVVIQQQVDADSAGVAFSINPLNNCYDEALINASHGLGEAVVSGAVEPDLFVVDKITRKIMESKIGSSGTVIRLNPQGGTTRAPRAAQREASLAPVEVLRIVDLLNQAEAVFQKPVDIEWAFANEQLYLLQARPITTYLPLPDEMVTRPGEPKRLYANSTLIEQGLQGPLSVLGTDFLGYVLNKVGGPVAEGAVGPDGVTFTAGGGYFMNLTYALKLGMRNAGLAPGSFGDPRVLAILDSIDMRQYLGGELPPKLKAMRGQMMLKTLPMVKNLLAAYLRPAATLRNYQAALPAELRRFEAIPTKGLSLREQAVQLTGLLKFFYTDYGISMILVAQIAQRRIKDLFKAEAGRVQDHLINLGVALPGNKTTEMGEWLYTLATAEEIARHESAAEFLADLEAKRLSPAFREQWDRFMAEFGFRCPGEIDPATPRPREQPARFFKQLKSMAQAIDQKKSARSFFEEARAKREAAYQALHAIAQLKGRRQARAFEQYYNTWVMFGGYRETPKHYVIKVIDLFRQRAVATGRAFMEAGRLDRPEQVFDLTIADIDQAQADPAMDLRAAAQARSQLIRQIRRSHLVARIIDSRGKIFFPPRLAAAEGQLAGVPISPGVARGRVRVFQTPDEKQLLPGEILVARATDPGWTPLFIHAGGIILEIGGALQHGAVVAREYGIPCVSGVDNATGFLQDGQLVEVDGSNGTVRMIE